MGSNSLILFGFPGKFKINEFPLVPAVCLLNIAFFEYFKDSSLIYSPKPGYSLSITSRVASGVTSLDDGPVPPVVIIISKFSISDNLTKFALIASFSSGTIIFLKL